MDISGFAKKLGLENSKQLIRKAEELRRRSDLQFHSSAIGIGEVCKAIVCLEIAASGLRMIFDRKMAVKLSGMSEKAYIRCFNGLQSSLGVKTRLDVRELGIQFGCVRLIPLVQKGISLYKSRFIEALPPSRRASTDFNRPVFTAVAFYLCAKRHKLKVDKNKLIELCGTSESEFTSVTTSMKDLCFDVFGIAKEKKDSKDVKCHRELLNVIPEKRRLEDDGDVSDDSSTDVEDGIEISCYKRLKKKRKVEYEDWKSNVIVANKQANKLEVAEKKTKQSQLNFSKKSVPSIPLKASSQFTKILCKGNL